MDQRIAGSHILICSVTFWYKLKEIMLNITQQYRTWHADRGGEALL